jgi:hypothetical protein
VVRRPWKRSFCASGPDRNRTVVLALVSSLALSAFGCFSVVPALALLLCRFVCAAKHWRPAATHSGGLAGSRNRRQRGQVSGDQHTEGRARDPATEATVLRRLLLCFSFFGEAVRRHPCSCCRGHGPSTVLAEGRQREQPRQAACGRFALALARRPAPAERRGRRGGRRRPARALPINAYGLSLAIVGA